jgi:phosphoribosylpyrophosphate synthetase
VHLLTTHAFFDADFHNTLRPLGIASLTVTDTVPPNAPAQAPSPQDPQFCTLSVAPIIGQCLARIHDAQSISPILDPTGLSR